MQNINWRDVGERVLWTFLQAFFGVLVARLVVDDTLNLSNFDVGLLQSAAVAGLAAVASLVKGVIASFQGSGNAALPG